jgi:putative tryptophan/tyrosine transport system substrate-binding protein
LLNALKPGASGTAPSCNFGCLRHDPPAHQTALRELGYVEGETVNCEYRHSEGAPDSLAAVVGELIRRPVDLIATFGTPPTEAAKAATTTIPIVMIGVGWGLA